MDEFIVKPQPGNPQLTRRIAGIDHEQTACEIAVPMERAFTLFLNSQEIVTLMTVGDHPRYLGVGFLLNQNMIRADDVITHVDVDDEIDVIVVRTERETDYEARLKKKTLTSGCAQGTVFGDIMEKFEQSRLADDVTVRTSWLYALARRINTTESLYLTAGAVHGCVLCQGDRPLIYMEDVGRHNAIDKIAGYMFLHGMSPEDKLLYTTGRLTSEMVIKCVQMRVPVLMSRSGFTASGVELARRAGLTLIGRARGKRFICVSGEDRLVYDADPAQVPAESPRIQRKASLGE